MPGVDLVVGQVLGRRVLRLDDPFDRPELAADDPAELRRSRRRRRWQARSPRRPDGAPRGPRRGRLRSRGARHPTARGPRSRRAGTTIRAARAASPVPRGSAWRANTPRSVKAPDDRLDSRRVDDDRPPAAGAVGRALPGVEDVRQHRSAAQLMEHLGRRGMHPRAQPGRQHDGDRVRRRCGTWGVHGVRRRPAVGRGRRAHRTRRGSCARSSGFIKGPGIVGVPRSGCQPRRQKTEVCEVRSAAAVVKRL